MLHEFFRCFSSTLYTEAYNATGAVWQIFFCKCMIFVIFQPAVIHISNLIILFQIFCNCECILTMTLYSDMQTLQSEIQDKCTLRRLYRTEITHQLCSCLCDKCALFSELLCICNSMITVIRCGKSREFVCVFHPVELSGIYDASTDSCSMSVHVFGCGMSYDICSPFDRTTVDRSRECIIYNKRYSLLMRYLCKLLNI